MLMIGVRVVWWGRGSSWGGLLSEVYQFLLNSSAL